MHVAPDEVPEVDDPTVKLLTVARRLGLRIGTCSSAVVDEAGALGAAGGRPAAAWPRHSAPTTSPARSSISN